MDLTASANPFLDLFDVLSQADTGTVEFDRALHGLLIIAPQPDLNYADKRRYARHYTSNVEAAIDLLEACLPEMKWTVLRDAAYRANLLELELRKKRAVRLEAYEILALAICTELLIHYRRMDLPNGATHRAPPSEGM